MFSFNQLQNNSHRKTRKKKKEKLVSLPLPAEDEPPCKKSSPNALPCLLYSSLPPPPSSLSLLADKSPWAQLSWLFGNASLMQSESSAGTFPATTCVKAVTITDISLSLFNPESITGSGHSSTLPASFLTILSPLFATLSLYMQRLWKTVAT